MNQPTEFLLLFRNTQLEKRLTESEMQAAMQRLNEWLARGAESGQMPAGQPLADEGRLISGSQQRLISDGPYAEAKEAVGGYVIIRAANLDEACALAAEWPLLDYGATVEVRPIRQQCATMEHLGLELVKLGA